MTCIYTGAVVQVDQYGITAPADVFEVDRVLIFRFSGNPQDNPHSFEKFPRPPTHIIRTMHLESTNWTRLDLGVIVVERGLVTHGPGHRENLEYRQGSGAADGGRNG